MEDMTSSGAALGGRPVDSGRRPPRPVVGNHVEGNDRNFNLEATDFLIDR